LPGYEVIEHPVFRAHCEELDHTGTGGQDAMMPRAYSLDLRERLLRAEAAGLRADEIERTTGVSARTLRRWRQRQNRGELLAPGHAPGRALIIGPAQEPALVAQVAVHPDATLAEHCQRWLDAHGVRIGISAMRRRLLALGLTLKKSP